MIPTLVSILIVSVLLLAIPVDLVLSLKREREEGWHGRIIVYWLRGFMRFRLRVGRSPKRRRRSLRDTGKQLYRGRRRLMTMLRSEGFMRQLVALVAKLNKELKPRRFKVKCDVGLDSPADTGRLVAILAPLKAIAGAMKLKRGSDISVQISPDFTGPRFSGYFCTSVYFVPLKLVGIFIGFLFSTPVLRAAKAALRNPAA